MSSMSVTQALAELKLVRKRLDSGLRHAEWASVATKTHPVNAEKFEKDANASLQSYTDLYTRYIKLKTAIVRANAATRVKVGSWEGSVADAIEYKRCIEFKKTLLESLRDGLTQARSEYEQEQAQVANRLERLLASELGKDVRTNPETITALTTSFRANNPVELVDPLNTAKRIKELEEEIDSFETNVDWVLSEANGRTLIEC